VILTEVYIAFFWFNPLLYFYRKSLKAVHEFQADKGVLQNGVKTSQYLQLLKQSLEVSKPNKLYNYFNQPILKKRVTMMTKPKSNRLAKLKYILLLPVCALLISAFTSPSVENNKYLNIIAVSKFLSATPSGFPLQNASKNDITSFFGEKSKRPKTKANKAHSGIDIRAKIGTPVIATADGIIAKAAMEGDWGNLIVITHADGYETWYAHLNGFNINENQAVKKGDIIGYVGNTGRSSGPHLHYEVKHNRQHLNPIDYME
jgi:murein DD-endopeptidase MepM/ murein hydrolase activator NlpD